MAIIDWGVLGQLRAEIGPEFPRILGYFREDGARSVAQIEEAMRNRDATRLVRPAHTLKGEAAQFGAEPLRVLSEQIEFGARRFVEIQETPESLLELVVQLRPLLDQTLSFLEGQTGPTPVIPRRMTGFGRKMGAVRRA